MLSERDGGGDMPKSQDYHGSAEVESRRQMGMRIDAAREKTGMNKGEFARKIGVTPATFTGWIQGKHSCTTENLRRIVEVTGEPSSFFNPESLTKRDSIERLSRDLGTILGKARLQRLLQVPDKRLRREVDAIIGEFVTEHPDVLKRQG